jgi:hypothetical protein
MRAAIAAAVGVVFLVGTRALKVPRRRPEATFPARALALAAR